MTMKFSLPIELQYKDRQVRAFMGPFEHSMEREFAIASGKKALDECDDIKQVKEVAKNLLEGWSAMNTAVQRIMLENIELHQKIAIQQQDLEAADELINEASVALDERKNRSNRASRGLWPFLR